MTRRTTFWLVLTLVGLLMVAIVSAVVFSLLDEDGVFGLIGTVADEVIAYFTVFGLVFADAIVPIIPGETTLTTASVAASDGTLDLAPDASSGSGAPSVFLARSLARSRRHRTDS
jgi:hypothetical protein